uniref:Tryptophan-rich sensory protein n=1 Tax=viral metagenome TaxID=1070528 RepID=A0A6C0BNR9_9ZZZZ
MWDFFLGSYNNTLKGGNLTARRAVGLVWFFAPLLIFVFSYLTSSDMGACVKFRPPAGTYSVVWIFLVLTLMASWLGVNRSAAKLDWIFCVIMYFLIIALSVLWLFMYKENKLYGVPVFLALLFVLFMTWQIASTTNKYSGALLWPLIIWAIFQLVVNSAEVMCD